MILFNVGLLRRTHRIAEEQGNLPGAVIIVFKGKNVSKFAAVITQESIEQTGNGNTIAAQKGFHGRKLQSAFSSGLVVHEKTKHEVARGKMNGHDDFAANSSDDSIQFHMAFQMVFIHISQKIVICTADFHTGRNIVCFPGLPGFEFDGRGRPVSGAEKYPFLK